MKIFFNILLHFKNYIKIFFSVFGNILKILFFYNFFTLSQLFSQFLAKFYIRKSTKIHHYPHASTHKQFTTIHTKSTTTQHRNHQNATTHTTTTTTKLEIKEIKKIGERVIGEKADRRTPGKGL